MSGNEARVYEANQGAENSWISGGALFFLALVLTVPALQDVFRFAPLHRWEMALLFVAGLVSILFAESVKLKAVRKVIYQEGE